MSALLSIKNLSLEITHPRQTDILRNLSLDVAAGCIVGLIGESGAGKTMVSRIILGLAPPNARVTQGKVCFNERDITHMPERERRALLGKDIALIPQNPMTALNPVARIDAQITDVLGMHLGIRGKAAFQRAQELIAAVHLDDAQRILRSYPHELSGGMRQRVLIAIAFACRPKLVIADEPTTALDMTVQKRILQLIKAMQTRQQCAVLFITHDLGVAAKLCDEVCVMHAGSVVECAPVRQLFENPLHPHTRGLLDAAMSTSLHVVA